jgi:hypothetical protein
MRPFRMFDSLSCYEGLEARLSLTSIVATSTVLAATTSDDDPLPDPEPSPGPYPGEDAPLEYPDPPPSGPVGPGIMILV